MNAMGASKRGEETRDGGTEAAGLRAKRGGIMVSFRT